MSTTQLLPFVTTAVMLIFTVMVLQRFVLRRRLHFLFWGVGLAMFGLASFAEAYLSLTWSSWAFFLWYFCGAILTAAWIGHGTLYLLIRKRWVHGLTALLIAGSLIAGYGLMQTMPDIDSEIFTPDRPISEQYRTVRVEPGDEVPQGAEMATITYRGEEVTVIRGLIPLGKSIRIATPIFNIYGTFALVGGALWSAYLFWRKRVLPNRVLGNMLIAVGALVIASASSLTRLGYGSLLYLGELIAAVLMFSGFLIAGRPAPAEEATPAGAQAQPAM
jgi:hypothetical protein